MILHHYIWGDIDIDIVEEVTRKAMQLYALLSLICSKRLSPHRGPVTSRSMVLP